MNEETYYTRLYEEQSSSTASTTFVTPIQEAAKPTPKRGPEDVLSWQEYFMCMAFLNKERSSDPRTKVGACIVNPTNKIVAIGHNDLPHLCKLHEVGEFKFDWENRDVKKGWIETKYPYVCHAAINAILNKNAENLKDCTLYTTLFPGHEDVKLIIQSGIKEVMFYYKKETTTYTEIAEKNLELAKIKTVCYPDEIQTLDHSKNSVQVFPQKNSKDGPGIDESGITDPDSDFFMALACLTSLRSKDPHRQVGTCLVNEDGKVVGFGYNGLPYGISDGDILWGNFKEGQKPSDVKYPYVVHAEANAIMHKTCIDLKECTLYTTLFPCNECAKLIIQSGIKKVYFLEGEPHSPATARHGETAAKKDKMYTTASLYLFQMAGYMMVFNTSLELPPDTAKFCRKYVPSKEFVVRFDATPRGESTAARRPVLQGD